LNSPSLAFELGKKVPRPDERKPACHGPAAA
jgi:hypothetical protein